MSEGKAKTAVFSIKPYDLSSRRFQTQRLRTLTSTSSPEERLKNTLNNYRTMVSILKKSANDFMASNPQESVSRSLQGSLEFKICRAERQLAQIIERN
ncbi:hypothetical protein OAL10_02330 [Gammaproteobacteria bacterium]|nr:hypothetical protein [Gammaproteobacteria bacterium]